jgi:hypothetical protein
MWNSPAAPDIFFGYPIAEELTPNLGAMPGWRSACGRRSSWTEVFLEATWRDEERKCKYPSLRRADFEPLAARALRGALTSAEMREICTPVYQRQLRSALPEIITLLKDEKEEVRSLAVEALGFGRFTEAAPAIVPVLKDKVSQVQILAIRHLRLHFAPASEIAAS